MTALPGHEERHVREYVNSQSPEDDEVTLAQKVGSRRIMGRMYELYDVHTEKSRWWVISDPMNLYSQRDFPEVDLALTFHLGLSLRVFDQNRTELAEEKQSKISGAWRRYEQAVRAMDTASEAEDFQAVGIKCREALLKLQEVGGGLGRAARRRSHAGLRILSIFGMLLHRRERGTAKRCPNCGSYGLDEDVEMVEEPESGFATSNVCRACNWRSERTFATWEEHFQGADIESYLKRSTGMSDRLHPEE